MSEMVERLAGVIAAGVGDDLPSVEIARRVLVAMREPTENMLFKGYTAKPLPPVRAPVTHYRDSYRAMIDAAARD